MLLYDFLQITNPSVKGLWLIRLALFLPSIAGSWVFLSQATVISNGYGVLICAGLSLLTLDIHQSLKRYMIQDVFFLLGEHDKISPLKKPVNIIVAVGVFLSLSITL